MGILRILIADRAGDVAAITPIAEGECVAESHEEFISITLDVTSQELHVAFETLEQAHEHEKELEQAVETTTSPEGLAPIYYKIAIVILALRLFGIKAL